MSYKLRYGWEKRFSSNCLKVRLHNMGSMYLICFTNKKCNRIFKCRQKGWTNKFIFSLECGIQLHWFCVMVTMISICNTITEIYVPQILFVFKQLQAMLILVSQKKKGFNISFHLSLSWSFNYKIRHTDILMQYCSFCIMDLIIFIF